MSADIRGMIVYHLQKTIDENGLNVDIFEGTYLNFKYTVNTSDTDQRFIIPNDNVDTNTLTVKIQESS